MTRISPRTIVGSLGIGLACAACCTAPVLAALSAFAGLGAVLIGATAAGLVLAAGAAVGMWV